MPTKTKCMITVKVKRREVEVKTLSVRAEARYWEDAEVNGIEDENGMIYRFDCDLSDFEDED